MGFSKCKAVSINDFRALAKRKLPKFLFEYIDGGSYAETTLRRNAADLELIELRQRVLCDVSDLDTQTELFGETLSSPVILAPVGLAGMYARRGEVQAARAAEEKGIPFCLSTVSVCPIEEVVQSLEKPFWFQLYMVRDRGFVIDLMNKAAGLGCKTLVFTVDMPVPGSRYRDYHSGLAGNTGWTGDLRRYWQALLHPEWAYEVGLLGRPHHLGNVAPVLHGKTGLEDFFAWMRNNFDPSISWQDIEFIRDHWKGTLIIKGILDKDDACLATQLGADGIVVSNHGGRQLDGVPSTVRALPPIAEAVGGKTTVLVDGGIRSGLDVVRMLAFGADSVMVGRPWAYALAAAGQSGVEQMLDVFNAEMRVAMALTGTRSLSEVSGNILANI